MHNLASVSSYAISKAKPFIYLLKKKKKKKKRSFSVHFLSHNPSQLPPPFLFSTGFTESIWWYRHRLRPFIRGFFIQGYKYQHPSHILADRRTSGQHKEPFTVGCGAQAKGQTGYKE